MHLEISIDQNKSDIFLNLLNVLKDDSMINDFKVINPTKTLNADEQEILDDISMLGETMQNLDKGKKTIVLSRFKRIKWQSMQSLSKNSISKPIPLKYA